MTVKEFNGLKRGDIVRNTGSGNSYVIVDGIKRLGFIAVRTITVTNPFEWEVVNMTTKEYDDK
jgi:hypothetical protein